jgi:hypothetical protein
VGKPETREPRRQLTAQAIFRFLGPFDLKANLGE